MKLIATNNFPNLPGNSIVLEDIKDEKGAVVLKQAHVTDSTGKALKNHIHKGARFSIGAASEFKDLSPNDRQTVAMLRFAGKVADATPANVERIETELKAEKIRDDADKAKAAVSDPLATLAKLVESLPQMVADAVAAALPKK